MTVTNKQPEHTELQDIKKKTISGAVSYFIRTLLLQGIGLASVALLSAFFSPEDFAIYGFVTQIIGILVFFSDIGLAAALVQKKEEPTQADYTTAFTLQQLLSWVIVLVSAVIAATGVVQAKTGTAGLWILASLAISFPLATFKTVPSVMLERKLQFSKLIVPQIFEQLLFQAILLFMAYQRFGAFAYTYAIFARSIIGVVSMWFIQPWPVRLGIDRASLCTLLGYGAKFQLNDFLARIKDQLFYLVLGFWLPLREFGYIQWAKNWSMYPYNLTVQNVMAITFPTFSRLQHHKQALSRAIEKSLFFITLTIFPILVGMCVFIKPLLVLVPTYNKWLPAATSMVFFSLSIGWSAISTPLTNTLNAIGHINTTLKLMVLWTALTWILTPLLLRWYGFNGVALAALVIATTSLLPAYLVKQHVPFSFWDQIWRQLLAVSVMAVVGVAGLSYWQTNWSLFILGVVLCGASYLVALAAVGWQKIWYEVRALRA